MQVNCSALYSDQEIFFVRCVEALFWSGPNLEDAYYFQSLYVILVPQNLSRFVAMAELLMSSIGVTIGRTILRHWTNLHVQLIWRTRWNMSRKSRQVHYHGLEVCGMVKLRSFNEYAILLTGQFHVCIIVWNKHIGLDKVLWLLQITELFIWFIFSGF